MPYLIQLGVSNVGACTVETDKDRLHAFSWRDRRDVQSAFKTDPSFSCTKRDSRNIEIVSAGVDLAEERAILEMLLKIPDGPKFGTAPPQISNVCHACMPMIMSVLKPPV